MVIIKKLKAIADAIRARTGGTEPLSLDEMAEAIESMEVSGGDDTNAYILVDENGYEVPAVLVDEPVMLTANAVTDIRKGMTAVTDEGVVTGEKEIPAYYTMEGMRVITAGKAFSLEKMGKDAAFTKMQALLCMNSVATDKVSINAKVYAVNSTEVLSEVVVDTTANTIDFGITNDSGKPYVIRYFTYREEY